MRQSYIRIDVQLSDRHSVAVRYNRVSWNQDTEIGGLNHTLIPGATPFPNRETPSPETPPQSSKGAREDPLSRGFAPLPGMLESPLC